MEIIVPKHLYVIDSLLDEDECQKTISLIDEREEITDGQIEQPMENRFQEQYYNPELASWFWRKFKDKLNEDISQYKPYGCAPHIPIVKYFDNGLATVVHLDPKREMQETFGVIIYLNEEHEGYTSFYNSFREELATIKPKSGKAVIFRLQNMWHKGYQPKAQKYIICPRIMCQTFWI